MLRIRIGQNCNRSMEKFVLHLTILSTLSNWRSFLMANAKTRRGKKKEKTNALYNSYMISYYAWSVHSQESACNRKSKFHFEVSAFAYGNVSRVWLEANGELKNGQLVELSAYKIVRQRRVDCDEELAVVDNSSWLLGLLTLLTLLEISNRRSPLRKQKQ